MADWWRVFFFSSSSQMNKSEATQRVADAIYKKHKREIDKAVYQVMRNVLRLVRDIYWQKVIENDGPYDYLASFNAVYSEIIARYNGGSIGPDDVTNFALFTKVVYNYCSKTPPKPIKRTFCMHNENNCCDDCTSFYDDMDD